jgi:hypothetical protein
MSKLQVAHSDVIHLYEEGKTIRQIAATLHISYGSVRNIMLKHNAPFRHRRQAPSDEILRPLYIDQRLSANEIAEQLGYPAVTIWGALKRYGIERRSKSEATKLSVGKGRFQLRFHLKQPDFTKFEELSYIMGVCKGDGSVHYSPSNRAYRIYLGSRSKAFVCEFQEALKQINLTPFCSKQMVQGSLRFEVVANSKIFCEWYKGLSYGDLLSFSSLPFLRGFIQSEGSYDQKRHYLDIGNTDRQLTDVVLQMIREMGIKASVCAKRYAWGKGIIYIIRTRGQQLCEIKQEYYRLAKSSQPQEPS